MLSNMSRLLVPIMLVALLAVTACGGSEESEGWDLLRSGGDDSAGHPGAPGAPAAAAASAPREVVVEKAMAALAAPAAAPAAPPAAPAPAPLRLLEAYDQAADADIGGSPETLAQLVNLERIIVRTVEATIVVTDVQGSMDLITAMARDCASWPS